MSVSEQQPARLAVKSVDDLVGLVPYLMGFHPHESLVVLVLEAGRLQVTARVDLAITAHPGELEAMLARLFGRFPTAQAWCLAYTEDEALAWGALADCAGLVGSTRLGRLIHVGRGRWRADDPDGPCGAVGTRVSATAAEASVLGMAPLPSRAGLAAAVAGPPDAEVGALVEAYEATAAELAGLGPRTRRRQLGRLVRAPKPRATADCIMLALLAQLPECQVAALASLGRGNAAHLLELWQQVARHSLVPQRPTVLGLLGMAAWQTGDGALQVVCLEEIDRIDPTVPLAALLDWLNREVVPPEEWKVLRAPLLERLEGWLRADGPPASRPRR